MDNKEYLELVLEQLKKDNLTQLWNIRAALIGIFGEENIMMVPKDLKLVDQYREHLRYKRDIQSLLSEGYYEFIIRFPEYTLTSESGKKHVIRNLFVRFHMDHKLRYYGGFMGLRTTYTEAEWVSDYAHSHLHGRALDWLDFCTGSGPINIIITDLKDKFDLNKFIFFLHNVKSYVAWESISGTPYRYISNIGGTTACPSNVLGLYPAQIEYIYNSLITSKTNDELRALFQPSFNNGAIEIKITDLIEQSIYEEIKNNRTSINNIGPVGDAFLSAVKKADGTYVNPSSSDGCTSDFRTRTCLKFKGVEIQSELISSERSSTIIAHPEITKYVTAKICRKLTRAATTFS